MNQKSVFQDVIELLGSHPGATEIVVPCTGKAKWVEMVLALAASFYTAVEAEKNHGIAPEWATSIEKEGGNITIKFPFPPDMEAIKSCIEYYAKILFQNDNTISNTVSYTTPKGKSAEKKVFSINFEDARSFDCALRVVSCLVSAHDYRKGVLFKSDTGDGCTLLQVEENAYRELLRAELGYVISPGFGRVSTPNTTANIASTVRLKGYTAPSLPVHLLN